MNNHNDIRVCNVNVICNLKEIVEFSSKGIIYDFIGNLNRITVSRLITESAAIH